MKGTKESGDDKFDIAEKYLFKNKTARYYSKVETMIMIALVAGFNINVVHALLAYVGLTFLDFLVWYKGIYSGKLTRVAEKNIERGMT